MIEYKQAIIIRTDLGMKKGKIAAQASHASLTAFLDAQRKTPKICDEWLSYQKKVVLKLESEKEIVLLFEQVRKILPCALIKDAGRTQVEPGSITALAIGPASDADINRFTCKLKLL
jgi:PTH2 family peptidyl-tRNA hydrolase